MPDEIIENPILNSPFEEPSRHFKFTDDGITNEIVTGRRLSSYFVPIPRPRKRGKQLQIDTEWTKDRQKDCKLVNRIRHRVGMWRQGDYASVTPTTRRLLEYWTNPERENKLFFCQIEALETAIYLTESPRNAATPGWKTTFAQPTTPPTLDCPVLHSKWRPAREKPLSWPC